MTILYEDSRILAVSKPSGQLVIPGRGDEGEPLNSELERRAGAKLFVVHRLDKEASGLVLFAKDAACHRALCLQLEKRLVHKTYLAVVEGVVTEDGSIEKPLRQFGSGRMGLDPAGKPSLTRYRIKERLAGATLLEVEPVTGRRHQIRVHLWALGHPILGDAVYGKNRPVGGAARLMLHALEAEFLDFESRPLRLCAPPPDDFTAVLNSFRPKA